MCLVVCVLQLSNDKMINMIFMIEVNQIFVVVFEDLCFGIFVWCCIEVEIIKLIYEIMKCEFGVECVQVVIVEVVCGVVVDVGWMFVVQELDGMSVKLFIVLQVLWEKDDVFDVEVWCVDDVYYDYDVYCCSYVEMYYVMGFGEIGYLLSCVCDSYFIQGYVLDIVFMCMSMIMQGGKCCDFCYVL